jgi:hypothetical protein
MGRKGKPGRDAIIRTDIIVHSRILVADSELRSSLQARIIWDLAHVPRSKASWIPVILALASIASTIEVSMEVEFLSRVVFVDILTTPF